MLTRLSTIHSIKIENISAIDLRIFFTQNDVLNRVRGKDSLMNWYNLRSAVAKTSQPTKMERPHNFTAVDVGVSSNSNGEEGFNDHTASSNDNNGPGDTSSASPSDFDVNSNSNSEEGFNNHTVNSNDDDGTTPHPYEIFYRI